MSSNFQKYPDPDPDLVLELIPYQGRGSKIWNKTLGNLEQINPDRTPTFLQIWSNFSGISGTTLYQTQGGNYFEMQSTNIGCVGNLLL